MDEDERDEVDRVFSMIVLGHRSQLIINENLQINFPHPVPNLWWRFWHKVLLGWQWKSLENK